MAEHAAGRPWFNEQRRAARTQPIEEVGARLRALMPFLKPVSITQEPAAAPKESTVQTV